MVTILSLWGQVEKPCSICQQTKPLTEYHKVRTTYVSYCKVCMTRLPSIEKELAVQGKKLCTKCAAIKPYSDFLKRKASRDGYDLECKLCKNKRDIEKHEQLLAQPRYVVTEKQCKKCHEVKSASEFYEDTAVKCSKDRLTSWCKDCTRKDALVRMNQLTYEQERSINIRWKYGITREQYNRQLAEQNGVCAICQKPETKVQYSKVMELAVDHEHGSGKPRGLLCSECNTALGKLRDDPNIINSLITYLKKNQNILSLVEISNPQAYIAPIDEHARKVCPRCQQLKPLSEYYKHAGRVSGHRAECKECRNTPHIQKDIFPDGHKRCSICRDIKPFEQFYKSTKAKDGYGYECRSCGSARGTKLYNIPFQMIAIIPGNSQCDNCLEVKSSNDFHIRRGNKGKCYIDRWCKVCAEEALKHPHNIYKSRVQHLQTYGLTIETYNKLLKLQNGVCAVCGQKETVKRYSKIMEMSIDHDHENGVVRGLMCSNCNSALGIIQDNLTTLQSMLTYLEKWT